MDELLGDLNTEQKAAVQHVGGPLLVLAGPGTGKTRIVTKRIAYRVVHDAIPPRRLLAITFTRRAANEMQSRVKSYLGDEAAVWVGTFHWICGLLLRRHVHHLGYSRHFSLLGPSESRGVLFEVLQEQADVDAAPIGQLAAAMSLMKNGVTLEAAARSHGVDPAILEEHAHTYTARLREANALDLDDLQTLSVRLLQETPRVRAAVADAFDEILIDEYQDVNPVQRLLLSLMRPESGSVTAVGDEDQAIYGWRQGDMGSVLHFADDFPGARIIKVQQTYRSTKHILRAASALIERNTQRFDKTLRTDNGAGDRPVCYVAQDERDEADWIASQIEMSRERESRPWDHFTILYRVGAQSRVLEDALLRHAIPYRVLSGPRFYERDEIRRVVAYLRLALDRSDDVAARFLIQQIPGVGPVRLQNIVEMAAHQSCPLLDILTADRLKSIVPTALQARLEALSSHVNDVVMARRAGLMQVVDGAIRATESEDIFSADSVTIEENLNELRSVARDFDLRKHTLRQFVDRLTPSDDSMLQESTVRLLTIHAAKGLEFPVVFIAGAEEGLLPHRRSLTVPSSVEEERRLMYVGMTRAKERLCLTYAHTRMVGGRPAGAKSSRFIGDIGRANIVLKVSSNSTGGPKRKTARPGERVLHAR